ncbi:uncharacterized protein BXIN_0086 [Babesia sp. Xinjiang]|uniref:uncharacterized protein n=1 Tax=Babesia sp. Xinjiang TaxID=462227 RepID=UPI000A224F81|nr:uncharacterized protein BXIN_0086 [Babesia sp. Xinjiang]ORM39626.1 hypothetical protein BXIN_0086 [Babesia sp. Xinjiang]
MNARSNTHANPTVSVGIEMYDPSLVPSMTIPTSGAVRFAMGATHDIELPDSNSDDDANMDEEAIDDQLLIGPKANEYHTVQSPRRIQEDRLVGFTALKTETFDNNFKDLEELKRKKELLHLAENYLNSKLYTPKLEALQRLVEPGKYADAVEQRLEFGHTADISVPTSVPGDSKESKGYGSSSSRELIKLGAADAPTSGGHRDIQGPDDKGDNRYKSSHIQRPPVEAKGHTDNVVTLVSSNELINGIKKKRITVPKSAYQPLKVKDAPKKVLLKVVGNAKLDCETYDRNDPESWLQAIEKHLESLTESVELYGTSIVDPKAVITQLEALRPPWMPPEIFFLFCMKPIGMEPHEFLKIIESHNINECHDAFHKFNIVNTNAMGYVLDAENEAVEELAKLNRMHKRLVNEQDIYTKILSKMTENFNNQVDDLLQITRQDLRLESGDAYLQYGSIKNITTWQKGDPVLREKGFSHDRASKDKMKTLQRMQEIFGDGSNITYESSSADEAKYIYYMKLLQDMEDSEREELQQQVARDRMQALAEYSVMEPTFKPDVCLAWKAVGVSCNSVIWKMYNTVECSPVIYKLRSLEAVDSSTVATLQRAYEQAFDKLKQAEQRLASTKVKFANGFEIRPDCIVERMVFIRDTPVSELFEKMAQMKAAKRFEQAQVVVREIAKMVYQLQNLDFILPLKSSRIYFFAGGAKLSMGIPQSLLSVGARQALRDHEKTTIASLLWGKKLEWYLPPEAKGDPAFTRDTIAVSKAHVWMIGKILYEGTCQTPLSRVALDREQIELCEDVGTRDFLNLCLSENTSKRPTVEELLKHPFMKRHKVNSGVLGPVDVGKVQCAVEILGDIETIVLNKINRTEKGVADYEQNDNWDTVLGESDEYHPGPLGSKYGGEFPDSNGHLSREMEIFAKEVLLRWMESSKITSVAWCFNNLIIGNDSGELYAFQAADIQGPVDADVYKFAKVSSQSIARICPLDPEEWLLVLNAVGDLYAVNAFFKGPPSILAKNVTCVVRQLGDGNHDGSGTNGSLKKLNQFCLGFDNKMHIYSAEGEKLTQIRSITVDGIVLSAAWLNNTIVVGTKEAYYIMDAECRLCHELCSLKTGDLETEVLPLTAACVDGDIMVVCQNIGIFYNTQTMALSKKNTIHWRNRLEALGCVPPFIVGITVDRIIEVYGVRGQLLYQIIDQMNAKCVQYIPDRECMITSTPNVVTLLRPKTYHQCIADMVELKDIKQVLHIVEVYFETDDPRRSTEMRVAHTIAGWMRFSDVNFPLAFQHFTLGDVDIVQLLEFWNHYAEIVVPESYVRNVAVPMLLRKYIPSAIGIREFVDQRYLELKDVLPPNTSKLKLLEMANVSFAAFLFKHFNAKTILQKNGPNMDEFQRMLTTTIEKTCLLLLAECDDPKCSLIINLPQEETFLDLDSCGEHLLKMDKREVFAKLLIKQQRYKEAMDIMAKYISDKVGAVGNEDTTLEIKSVCCELAACLNTLIETSQRDYSDQKPDIAIKNEINEILNMYLPVLLATYPNAALDVLTRNHTTLPFTTDQIIAMIDLHAPKSYCSSKMAMRIKYLEDLVIKTKHGSMYENTLLAKHYITELTAHKKSKDAKDEGMNAVKNTLLEIMESNNNLHMAELEAMLVKLDIVEATVLLYNKLNRHDEALRTLFERWNKDERLRVCEAYCLCFGEITASYDTCAKDVPFKKLFSNFDCWMQKAREWPLTGYEMYKINNSDTSIDRLLLHLLTIIVQHSDSDDSCVYLARDLLAKYIPLCTHKAVLNGSTVVELLPENWNFAIFANIFMQLQLKALHEQRSMAMRRGLTRSLHSQTAKHLYKLTCVPPITIDARSTCAICQEPIKLGMSIAIPPPNQSENSQQPWARQHVIMHEQCAKGVHDK